MLNEGPADIVVTGPFVNLPVAMVDELLADAMELGIQVDDPAAEVDKPTAEVGELDLVLVAPVAPTVVPADVVEPEADITKGESEVAAEAHDETVALVFGILAGVWELGLIEEPEARVVDNFGLVKLDLMDEAAGVVY